MTHDVTTTGFFRELARFLSWRTLPSLLLMALALELLARASPFLVGKYVHQPFLRSVRRPELLAEPEYTDREVTFFVNERGARGSLSRRGAPRIAILGSSTSADSQLRQDESMGERIGARLGGVPVDNYASDGSFHRETALVLEELAGSGERYEVAIVMTEFHEEPASDHERRAFRYWGQWAPRDGWIQADWLLSARIEVQVRREPRVDGILKAFGLIGPSEQEGYWERVRGERERRLSGGIPYSDAVPSFDEDRVERIREAARRIFVPARALADEVLFLCQPIAYDEDELEGVSERWCRLRPAPDDPNKVRSNRSMALEVREKNRLMAEVAIEMGVRVFDLDAGIRPHLKETDDLFYDRWHFLPRGADLAGRLVADELLRVVPERIRARILLESRARRSP